MSNGCIRRHETATACVKDPPHNHLKYRLHLYILIQPHVSREQASSMDMIWSPNIRDRHTALTAKKRTEDISLKYDRENLADQLISP